LAPRRSAPLRVVVNPRPAPLVSNAVLGTLIFLFTEVMLFAGLISAHSIARASSAVGWPPPGQPRLPFEETAVNTAALLLSGVAVFVAQRAFGRDRRRAFAPLAVGFALGVFFVFFQGVEWVRLIGEGLTLTSSTHGAFFYLIVGVHGLHALAALVALGWALLRLRRSVLPPSMLAAAALFWYFVVGVWPIVYLRVYR
jgi:heme/copper-type cytochrome/quinol oxidase subunit 3